MQHHRIDEVVMDVSGLVRQGALNLETSIARLSRSFTLSSAAYCAVHWLITHKFSLHVLPGALLFGAFVAVGIACLSAWLRSRRSSPTQPDEPARASSRL
jgi:hypothetical protein